MTLQGEIVQALLKQPCMSGMMAKRATTDVLTILEARVLDKHKIHKMMFEIISDEMEKPCIGMNLNDALYEAIYVLVTRCMIVLRPYTEIKS